MGNRKIQAVDATIFEEFFRMSTDLCVISDFEGYFRVVSPSWTTTLGYTEDELLSRKYLDFVHPDDRAKTTEESRKVSQGQSDIMFENRYIAKDGSIRWLHWRSITDLERKIIFATARDITEQKRQQEALAASNRRTARLLETITDGFMSVSSDWRLTYANSKALKIWGKPNGIGKPIVETIPDFFGSGLHKRIQEALASGRSMEFEEHRGHTSSWLKGSVYPNSGGFVLFLRDVTEQKAFEIKMREQHEMLIQASKLSSLGAMAGEIAHEINTPLSVILINVELLSEMNKEEIRDQEKAGNLIQATAETVGRISRIVKGLRNFARGAKQEPTVSSSVATIVDETLALCAPKFKTGQVKIHRPDIDPNLMIECRPIQISQVLLNLLNNAYDAVESLPERWIRIELADKGESIELSVVDSGPGINESHAKKIMEPYFTTKPAGKGTGLGLSISSGILQGHCGRLIVDSTCLNAKFVMEIPKRQAAGGESAA